MQVIKDFLFAFLADTVSLAARSHRAARPVAGKRVAIAAMMANIGL
jgi:hypothetical protein